VCGGFEAVELAQIQSPLVAEDRLLGFGQVEERRFVWPKAIDHRSLGQRPR
jgi:hypothetical protein